MKRFDGFAVLREDLGTDPAAMEKRESVGCDSRQILKKEQT